MPVTGVPVVALAEAYRLQIVLLGMAWFEEHPEGAVVTVWVVPGSSRTEIAGFHGDALRIRVAAPAEGGKANRALISLLRSVTGARSVRLLRGSATRRKTLLLVGIVADDARVGLEDGAA
jgi:uncharacterized protein